MECEAAYPRIAPFPNGFFNVRVKLAVKKKKACKRKVREN
jgi:hypothetical protein